MNHLESKIRQIIGDFDPKAPPPPVDPLANSLSRPRWSVMIPTFNCAQYLRQTLESVLAQDPGPELMQIEVIDDCSTKDDPEAVVREVGKGRVSFYRKEKNAGATANFNTCIERSKGEYVHILHGDDWVLPGFYQEVEKRLLREPTAGMAIVRAYVVNEDESMKGIAPCATEDEGLLYEYQEHLMCNDFYTPGHVFRRSSFEKLGAYRLDLIHVADWEITVRVYQNLGSVYIKKPMACYRFFSANDTGKLAMEAKNIIDYIKFSLIAKKYFPLFNDKKFVENARDLAIRQCAKFITLKKRSAFLANLDIACKLDKILSTKNIPIKKIMYFLKIAKWNLKYLFQKN